MNDRITKIEAMLAAGGQVQHGYFSTTEPLVRDLSIKLGDASFPVTTTDVFACPSLLEAFQRAGMWKSSNLDIAAADRAATLNDAMQFAGRSLGRVEHHD